MQSDYLHFSVHSTVPRNLGTRLLYAVNLSAYSKHSLHSLKTSSARWLPHLDVEPSVSLSVLKALGQFTKFEHSIHGASKRRRMRPMTVYAATRTYREGATNGTRLLESHSIRGP